MLRLAIVVALASSTAAAAQPAICVTLVDGNSPNTAGAVSSAGQSATQVASAIAAAVPQPATTTPPSEAVGGAVGSGTQYALANHVHPRITRAGTWTVAANGVLNGSWSTPLAAAPNTIYTPTAAGTVRITCQNTSTPTATGFAAVCWQDAQVALNSTVVLGGVNVGPSYAPVGTVIQVTAIPPSQ